jgi:hypothetical protein
MAGTLNWPIGPKSGWNTPKSAELIVPLNGVDAASSSEFCQRMWNLMSGTPVPLSTGVQPMITGTATPMQPLPPTVVSPASAALRCQVLGLLSTVPRFVWVAGDVSAA